MRFTNDQTVFAAVDLGGTNLRMAAVSGDGRILYRTERKTPRSENCDEIVSAITDGIRECRENAGIYKIGAVGAAVPGAIDYKRGLVTKSPNLPALDGCFLAGVLENELNLKVLLDNDANAAAVGESWLGAARESRHSICITLGTGVGGGIIIDRKILHGALGSAGEIGHVCVEPFGVSCGCGARGCLEQYTSATAIVRMTKELSASFPGSILEVSDELTSRDVYAAGRKGDLLALEVFRKMGFYLGISLAALVNLLNPQTIVIGGGASAGWDLFIHHVKKEILERAYRLPAENTEITRAVLMDDAGLLGAAKLAADEFLTSQSR